MMRGQVRFAFARLIHDLNSQFGRVFCRFSGVIGGGIVKIVCVGGGPTGLYFSILMKLWNPANKVIVFERNKEGVTHGWGVTMERRFLNRLAGLDAESAAEIAARSVSWREQAVEITASVRSIAITATPTG